MYCCHYCVFAMLIVMSCYVTLMCFILYQCVLVSVVYNFTCASGCHILVAEDKTNLLCLLTAQ